MSPSQLQTRTKYGRQPLPDHRLRLVGRPVGEAMSLPEPAPDFVVRPADLWLFQTSTPIGLAQVECVREVSKTLVPQMLFYRDVITQAYPFQPLDQYVIVTGDGRTREFDDPVYTADYFGLHVLYLRDVDPPAFQASPGFALLRECRQAPHFASILIEAGMALGRFLVSLQDDDQDDNQDAAVLHDSAGPDRSGIPEQLLSLFFQGRFGAYPPVPAHERDAGWPIDVAVALAVHAITDFDQVRIRALSTGRR